jgi:undecaprenyl-diphosphatase
VISRIKILIEWLGARAITIAVIALILTFGAWAFLEIAEDVTSGASRRFDEWAVRSLRKANDPQQPIGPAWVGEVARDVTALGGVAVLTLVTAAVIGYLWLEERYGAMKFIGAATVGGVILSSILKHFYRRPRPELVAHLSSTYTTSFPSGHSMLSATVYLTLGLLMASFVRQRRLKFYFVSIALGVTFLVGVSRVFMGVHYPTDVLAGWSAGLTWALLCAAVARYLQRRGAVEKSVVPDDA